MADKSVLHETYERICVYADYGNRFSLAELPEEYQVFASVYNADGIIGNGGFQYLFEGENPDDPEFLRMRQAYVSIGAVGAMKAIQKAFAVFPNSTPPADIDSRLEIWQKQFESTTASFHNDQSPDRLYFASSDETDRAILEYIAAHKPIFDLLT